MLLGSALPPAIRCGCATVKFAEKPCKPTRTRPKIELLVFQQFSTFPPVPVPLHSPTHSLHPSNTRYYRHTCYDRSSLPINTSIQDEIATKATPSQLQSRPHRGRATLIPAFTSERGQALSSPVES